LASKLKNAFSTGTPYVNAFLLLNLFLVAADYHKIKFLFFDDAQDFREVRLRRRQPKIDALWFAGTISCLAAGALYSVNRRLTFGSAATGVLIFLLMCRLAISRQQSSNSPGRGGVLIAGFIPLPFVC
jgi:hypothetical protein